MVDLEEQVKRANRDFYDIVGPAYETIDGRRSERLRHYVAEKLELISRKTAGESILDLGCGSGFIAISAEPCFKQRYAFDISFNIINAVENKTLRKGVADSDRIPLQSSRLDCVVTFALLHHCYAYEKMLSEIYRVLKRGGVYYSDHDMDSSFFRRFNFFLKIHRKIHDARRKYLSEFNQLTEEMYDCSEIHQKGIPSETVEATLKCVGFKEVKLEYHWFGLSSSTDKLFGKKSYHKGYAPLVRITAIK